MARVKFSPIIDSLNGKISNVVFQDGKAGSIARNRVVPTNPNTTAQASARGILSAVSKAWRGLTEIQRLAWDSAAASSAWRQTNSYGEGFQLSGEQLYVKLNAVLSFIQEGNIVSPPAKATFDSLTMGALAAAAGAGTMTQAFGGTLSSDFQFMVSASPQVSAGVMSSKSVRFSNVVTTTGSTPIDLAAGYVAKFGALTAGQKVFVRLEIASDLTGETLVVGETSTIVAA